MKTKTVVLVGCGLGGVLFLLCGGLVTLFVVGVFAATQPVVDASESFLSLVGQGKTADAYAGTAASYQAKQNEASFAAGVKQLGLTEYASASWNKRNIANDTGTTAGTVTLKDGTKKDVAVDLVNENGTWKVSGVTVGGADLAAVKVTPPVPAPVDLDKLVRDTLSSFGTAVRAKNFNTFYAQVSDVWKKQTSPAQLLTAFQTFVDKKADLGDVKSLKPEYSPVPAVDADGVLSVVGTLDGESTIHFDLKYIQEKGAWKLFGIKVRLD
jgi:ABC-type transporter MlaC component